MEEYSYKKFELYTTTNLARDKEEVDKIKCKVESILKDYNIEYALEILEKNDFASNKKYSKKIYCLNLIIKSEKSQIVKELLETKACIEYKDLENEDFLVEEDCYEENPIKEKISYDEEPIIEKGVYNQKNEKDSMSKEDIIGNFSEIYFVIICAIIMAFEIFMIIYVLRDNNDISPIGIIIAIIIEIPIIRKIWISLENRKGN